MLLNGDVPEVAEGYAADLSGLADAKEVSQRFLDRRLPAVDAIAESLAFQFGDWNERAPSHRERLALGDETGLPEGADRDLVLEAQAIGAHAFLTRDREVLEKTTLSGPRLAVIPPKALADRLVAAGVQLFGGGTCGGAGCPYDGWSMPAPDMGKWGGLLSIFQDD